jgi:hypothetical protein
MSADWSLTPDMLTHTFLPEADMQSTVLVPKQALAEAFARLGAGVDELRDA